MKIMRKEGVVVASGYAEKENEEVLFVRPILNMRFTLRHS